MKRASEVPPVVEAPACARDFLDRADREIGERRRASSRTR